MEKTTFDLDAHEAALIFKKDFSIELVIPKMDDNEEVDFNENQNIFVAMAMAALADHPLQRQLVGAKLDEMLGMTKDEGEGCSPEGCAGGCCGSAPPTTDGDTADD